MTYKEYTSNTTSLLAILITISCKIAVKSTIPGTVYNLQFHVYQFETPSSV